MSAHFYGVGVGPGDPELITLKAARLIAGADVVAYHAGTGKQSMARSIAADLIPEGVVEEELRYPVTTGFTDHPRGYYGALADFYDECSDRLEAHLAAGRTVVVLAVGDPLFFGSFMYVHDRLSPRYPTEVVPGITSLSAATAAVATGLCRHEDTLTVLPGTLPVTELARRLADTDAAIIMKLGRTFAGVREALRRAGVLERAVYVERASGTGEVVLPAAEVDEGRVPYMSLVVVPGEGLRDDAAGRAADFARLTATTDEGDLTPPSSPGTVHVVGLGPGPDRWLTPRRPRSSPGSTTSSATAPTSPECRSGRGWRGTPRATAWRPTAAGSHSTWPAPGTRSRSSPAGTRGSSGWRRRSSSPGRSPSSTTPATRTSGCGWCPA